MGGGRTTPTGAKQKESDDQSVEVCDGVETCAMVWLPRDVPKAADKVTTSSYVPHFYKL